jgi:hypothetical protein
MSRKVGVQRQQESEKWEGAKNERMKGKSGKEIKI